VKAFKDMRIKYLAVAFLMTLFPIANAAAQSSIEASEARGARGATTVIDVNAARKIDEQALKGSVSATEAKQSRGRFHAELVLADNKDAFYKAWNSSDDNVHMPVIERALVDQPIHAFVMFGGCTPNQNGKCTVAVSYRIYYPDGRLHSISITEFPLRDSDADEGLLLSKPAFLRAKSSDPLGAYLVVARIRDLTSDVAFELRKLVQID
jgi:hypothetical protein